MGFVVDVTRVGYQIINEAEALLAPLGSMGRTYCVVARLPGGPEFEISRANSKTVFTLKCSNLAN